MALAFRRSRRVGRADRARRRGPRGRAPAGPGRGRRQQGRRPCLRRQSRRINARPCTQTVTAQLGPIDILVNNAGTSQRGPFLESHRRALAERSRSQTVRRDPPGPHGAAGHAGTQMGAHHQRPQCRRQGAHRLKGAPTAVTRAAGMALTKVLAGEAAKHNVLVNALLVGLIDSNQHEVRASGCPAPPKAMRTSSKTMSDANGIPMGQRWSGPRSSPMSPASWPPTGPATSPAWRSMSMAAAARLFRTVHHDQTDTPVVWVRPGSRLRFRRAGERWCSPAGRLLGSVGPRAFYAVTPRISPNFRWRDGNKWSDTVPISKPCKPWPHEMTA